MQATILCTSTIYTFNIFNKQTNNEHNNNPIQPFSPHSDLLRFLLIHFFLLL